MKLLKKGSKVKEDCFILSETEYIKYKKILDMLQVFKEEKKVYDLNFRSVSCERFI